MFNTVKPFSIGVGAMPFNIQQQQVPAPAPVDASKSGLAHELTIPRFQNYAADYSGCGMWRIHWPSYALNALGKAVVHTTTVMNLDPRYFVNTKSVRIQRQSTPQQLEYAKFLRRICDQTGMRMIYEIDDISFKEDIPDYNRFKPAFSDPEIRRSSCEIMAMCDEMSVTCDFMRDYYIDKTGNKKITVVPNFMPKFWIGNFCDISQNMLNLDKYKKKPRILYTGSGAHFDTENRTGNYKDDFFHVNDIIRKTVDQFQWVFLGGCPIPLLDLVRSGKIEYHKWANMLSYGEIISKLDANIMIAPLADNNFNKAKSDLKYIESCAFGLPIVCQDLVTYSNAPIKFKTGDDMIDQIKKTLRDTKEYKSHCKKARQYAETRWLENEENINCYLELYDTPYGDPARKNLSRFNKTIV